MAHILVKFLDHEERQTYYEIWHLLPKYIGIYLGLDAIH